MARGGDGQEGDATDESREEEEHSETSDDFLADSESFHESDLTNDANGRSLDPTKVLTIFPVSRSTEKRTASCLRGIERGRRGRQTG
jgi:hypothetical protein